MPVGAALRALEEDYGRTVENGLLFNDAEPFERLIARCPTSPSAQLGWVHKRWRSSASDSSNRDWISETPSHDALDLHR